MLRARASSGWCVAIAWPSSTLPGDPAAAQPLQRPDVQAPHEVHLREHEPDQLQVAGAGGDVEHDLLTRHGRDPVVGSARLNAPPVADDDRPAADRFTLVHRLASDPTARGVATSIASWRPPLHESAP